MSTERSLLRLGVVSLVVAVAAWAWDLLAHQVPSSPWHLHGYATAIDPLAQHAWVEAVVIFALAPRAFANQLSRATRNAIAVNLAAIVGTALSLGSLVVSARTGVLARQLRDTSAFATTLLVVRLTGDALLLFALVLLVRAAMREARSPPAGSTKS